MNFNSTGEIFNAWILGFLVACTAGLTLEIYTKRTYNCPECGSRLGPPRIIEQEKGQQYVYDCPNCQITWCTLTYLAKPDG
jgi:DNA-directed RNA polymerase subunit RPC12/RpoP